MGAVDVFPSLDTSFPRTAKYELSDADTEEEGISTISSSCPSPPSPGFSGFADEALEALDKGATLQLADEDCVGGTYFLKQRDGEILGVFKPGDEEAASPGNPKGLTNADNSALKVGFVPGNGWVREIAAYLLDHQGFAGVPETVEFEVPAEKLGRGKGGYVRGSLQRYVSNTGQSWDSGPARFSASAARRIGLLDLRLLNCDRHGGNILTSRGAGKVDLIPIDHGYCLPTSLSDLDFEWQMWPQANTPFTPEELEYVEGLDPEEDMRRALVIGIDRESAELLRAATIGVKVGCSLGLTLGDLAKFYRREMIDEPSPLELIITRTREGFDTEYPGAIRFDEFTDLITRELSAAKKAKSS
eukprot:Sspe_Gene.15787::Locus_5502_Transcript_2_3_Confidence_0.600_Length_1686::g.15787::m.15787